METGIALQSGCGFRLRVDPAQGQETDGSRQPAQAVHSSHAPSGRDCGEGDRLAQLPSFAGDEPVGDGSGREGGARIIASCERQNDARYLHQSGLAAEARREREGGRDDIAGAPKKLQHPRRLRGGRVVTVNNWY